jgi:hypothetical protein
MRERMFWIACFILALSAVGLHLTAFSKVGNGVRVFSARTKVEAVGSQTQSVQAEVRHDFKVGEIFRSAGMVLAMLSGIMLFVSVRRNEPVRHTMSVICLACYLLLQFVLI